MDYAPIAVFAYNRPLHTRRLFESLDNNPVFHSSPLHVYCDGPKHCEHARPVAETREVVRQKAPKDAKIIERNENLGLARSIITGVTKLCEEYGRVIVLEDDLVLSPHALEFLNLGLEQYADEERVMHVSAYMYPVLARFPSALFYREATCWGWGTWASAWERFDEDADRLVAEIDEQGRRSEFNINDSMYFYQMLCKQRDGTIDSWAIRWYASMFRAGGLALHPPYSLVQNLGFDGSGVHCNVDSRFEVELGRDPVHRLPAEIEETPEIVPAMIEYRRRVAREPVYQRRRLRSFLKKVFRI